MAMLQIRPQTINHLGLSLTSLMLLLWYCSTNAIVTFLSGSTLSPKARGKKSRLMTWLSVKMGLNFIVANDPNQMTLHFTFPVFRLQPTERWKWLTNGDGVGRNGKESESCLYLCRLLYYFRRSHRKKKTFWWSLGGAPYNMAKRRRRSFFRQQDVCGNIQLFLPSVFI